MENIKSPGLAIQSEMQMNANKWNELYQSHNGVQFPHEQLVIYVSYLKQKAMTPNSKLKALEVGFGSIADLVMLYHKGYEIHGLEVSENAVLKGVAAANSMNIPINLQRWTPYEMPFKDRSFDLFCSSNSFHFNLEHDIALAEVNRVLNEQGKLYITYLAPGHKFMDHADFVGENLIRFRDTHPVPKMRQMVLCFYDNPDTLKTLYEKYFNDVRVTKLEYNIMDNPNVNWIVTASI